MAHSDLFDFDRIVDEFKKYVYNNGSELRLKSVAQSPQSLAEGYRYEIFAQKSVNHLKMENNHAVVEDLNTFGKINMP